MNATARARHARRRPPQLRRLAVVTAGSALLVPLVGVSPGSATTVAPAPITVDLPDGAPTRSVLRMDLNGDGTYETERRIEMEGKAQQSVTFGFSGTFTELPVLSIVGSCRTLTARLGDSAFAVIADHTYKPSTVAEDGTTVVDDDFVTDRYGKGAVADTPNPGVQYTLCR